MSAAVDSLCETGICPYPSELVFQEGQKEGGLIKTAFKARFYTCMPSAWIDCKKEDRTEDLATLHNPANTGLKTKQDSSLVSFSSCKAGCKNACQGLLLNQISILETRPLQNSSGICITSRLCQRYLVSFETFRLRGAAADLLHALGIRWEIIADRCKGEWLW